MDGRGGGRRGRFLVLDGIDGCGKSTQAELLVSALARLGALAPLHLREPGSTAAGERVRALLLDPEIELGPAAEALLLAAARRQMLDELVRPALAAGRDVVCERFHPSTFAYQAVAGGLDEERVLELLEAWAGDPSPDLVVLLELDLDEAAARRAGAPADRIEARGRAFQERVAAGYRRWAARAAKSGARVAVVAAAGTPDEVARRVRAEVERAGA
jgi:dTMP kinase